MAQQQRQIFARLTPYNVPAISAFSDICQALNDLPNPHHEQFKSSTDRQVRLASILPAALRLQLERGAESSSDATQRPDSDSDDPERTIAPELSNLNAPIWRGAFEFSLDQPPKIPELGWVAGFGRDVYTNPDREVDLWLSCFQMNNLRGNHVVFHFNHLGLFSVRAVHSGFDTRVNGQFLFPHHGFRMMEQDNIIDVGGFSYKFEQVITNTKSWQKEVSKYLAQYSPHGVPAPEISAGPTRSVFRVAGWSLQSTVGVGNSVVKAVVHQDHGPAAMKTIFRTSKEDNCADRELHVCLQMRSDLRGKLYSDRVMHIRDAHFSSGSKDFTVPDEAYLFFVPLAKTTFQVLIPAALIYDRSISKAFRIAYCRQILEGLLVMHECGWVHCDIKPANLGILRSNSPRAIVMDHGSATHLAEWRDNVVPCRPGQIGTVSYRAPEMDERGWCFDQKVDIWSLGCVFLDVFFNAGHSWKTNFNIFRQTEPDTSIVPRSQLEEARSRFVSTMTQLASNKRTDSLHNLVFRMLQQDSSQRCTTAEALAHPFWQSAAATSDEPWPE